MKFTLTSLFAIASFQNILGYFSNIHHCNIHVCLLMKKSREPFQSKLYKPKSMNQGKYVTALDNETNKLIIANKNPQEKAHINFLKSNAILHENKDELIQILTSWKDFKAELKNDFEDNDYKMYTPEKVMNIFKKVFLV